MFSTTEKNLHAFFWALTIFSGFTLQAQAADIKAGQEKAAMCVTCHGAMGLSSMPNAPHLAGQPAIYTEEQLKHYRSGQRTHAVMEVIAKPLTNQEIANLAAWYASIPIEVGQTK